MVGPLQLLLLTFYFPVLCRERAAPSYSLLFILRACCLHFLARVAAHEHRIRKSHRFCIRFLRTYRIDLRPTCFVFIISNR